MSIVSMGHFTAIGMRVSVKDPAALLAPTPGPRERYRVWPCVEDLGKARQHAGLVYLRDFDTGRGIDRNGPMSHAWVLAVWLNTGSFPS